MKLLRKSVADTKEVPPYVVFQELSLKEMATTYPTNMEDLSHILVWSHKPVSDADSDVSVDVVELPRLRYT